jgi:hypothetical protein
MLRSRVADEGIGICARNADKLSRVVRQCPAAAVWLYFERPRLATVFSGTIDDEQEFDAAQANRN